MTDIKYLKTGIFQLNHFPLIYEEINDGINESQDLRVEEFYNDLRTKYELPDIYDFDKDILNIVDECERDSVLEWDSQDTILIGYMRNNKNEIIEDPNADCQIICWESEAAVVSSKYYQFANKCSPCFPYQSDIETEGSEECYTLPEKFWEESKPDWLTIYDVPEKHENLTAILLKGKV